MNENVTWLGPTVRPEPALQTRPTPTRQMTVETETSEMNETPEPTGAAYGADSPAAQPPVRHGQIILGVVAIVAATAVVLNLTTSVFSHGLALPVVMLTLGVFVLVYGLVALRAGRPLDPGEEERRERRALTRITKQEQRRARRTQR